jgi:hypothetical protein
LGVEVKGREKKGCLVKRVREGRNWRLQDRGRGFERQLDLHHLHPLLLHSYCAAQCG